jgi:2-haloacid dehalogenase
MAGNPAADRAQAGAGVPDGIRTLLFDVLGTVVDEAGSIAAEVSVALAAAGADPAAGPRLGDEWMRCLDALIDQVRTGEAPWRSSQVLRRAALDDAARAARLDGLPPPVLNDLARAGHRFRPWPDSARALHDLASSFTVVALSNADLAELAGIFAGGGLAWHAVLSGELVQAYKPDPAVYRMALNLLDLDPHQTMMVAAHPWDLRAAAQHGMRTGYVSRPGEAAPGADDRFDVYAKDLADLAMLLAPGVG